MAVRPIVQRKPRCRVQTNHEARLVILRGGPYDKASIYLTPGVGSLDITIGSFHGYYASLGNWFDLKQPAHQEVK